MHSPMMTRTLRRFAAAISREKAGPSLASLVGKLRSESGQSFFLCKKAVEAASMNLDRARVELASLVAAQAQNTQTSGLANEQKQGLIGVLPLDNNSFGLIEMRCLSDFVARNPLFVELGTSIVKSLTSRKVADVEGHLNESGLSSSVLDAVGRLKEPITISKLQLVSPQPGELLSTYVHQQIAPGFGTLAAVVGLSKFKSEILWASKVANSMAKQVAGMNPLSVEELLSQEFLFNPKQRVQEYLASTAQSENYLNLITVTTMIRASL